MAAEDQTPRAPANPEKTKKRKKPKKDKWGQPIAAAADEPAAQQVHETPEEPAAEAEEAGERSESYECGKVVASGMPYTTTEEEIRGLFDKFGPIRSLQLSRFPDSGNFRGLAFVTFEVNTELVYCCYICHIELLMPVAMILEFILWHIRICSNLPPTQKFRNELAMAGHSEVATIRVFLL
jgi:hypothetical protein